MDLNSANRVFVTGDVHGDMKDLKERVDSINAEYNTTKDDILIILGDCGFFIECYYDKVERDHKRQRYVAENCEISVLCVQGNHEQPFDEMDCEKCMIFGSSGYYSNGIWFLKNGAEFNINGSEFLSIGGASSIDKERRLAYGYPYWENEEVSAKEFDKILTRVDGKRFDFMLSHTCPYGDMPREAFIKIEKAYTNGNATENYLQLIRAACDIKQWYCGHFHINKDVGNLHFLYEEFTRII